MNGLAKGAEVSAGPVEFDSVTPWSHLGKSEHPAGLASRESFAQANSAIFVRMCLWAIWSLHMLMYTPQIQGCQYWHT